MKEETLDRKGLETINLEVLSQIEDAVKFAVESPYPDPEDALKGVYSE
jgi:TPP-dependent pyruvate/acetoin dehydrogenase alpha subunit